MLNWTEYINQLVNQNQVWANISLSIGEMSMAGIPPIVKSSILLLDDLQQSNGYKNIVVFPERLQTSFIFAVSKLLFNISEGRIDHNYDPSTFQKGDKLRCGKAIVEFVGVNNNNGNPRMEIKLAKELYVSAPIEFFPFFQKVNTKLKLSNHDSYIKEKRNIEKQLSSTSTVDGLLQTLSDYRTHMENSIVYMTPVISTKEIIANTTINGKKLTDYALIGQVNYSGEISNVSSGQLSGVPSIILASDLYSVLRLKENGHPIQSIIIDISNAASITNQLDALNELIYTNIPIACVTDVVNSFDLQPFSDRNFNTWRWNENSITELLYNDNSISINRKIEHCVKRDVKYLKADGKEISEAFKLLSSYKSESKNQSAEMMKAFDSLYGLAFTALRETIPFSSDEIVRYKSILAECTQTVSSERPLISKEIYESYSKVISLLSKVFSSNYNLAKHNMLSGCISDYNDKSICVILPEKADKNRFISYWNRWCDENSLINNLTAVYPSEFYATESNKYDITIVVRWLKRAIMRKILYSFNTSNYIVLLYDYENRWKKYDNSKWNSSLHNSENKRLIDNIVSKSGIKVRTERFIVEEAIEQNTPKDDELNEIELILRENKYNQYVARGGTKPSTETVEAIPVNYIGNYLAFYRTGHKIISASDIILNEGNIIKNVLPSDLHIGDFVVVREADKDIIRELADVILSNSGKSHLREISMKWKEALEIETLFYTNEEIYEHLKQAGCKRGQQTVYGWLTDSDLIAPQDKQDLEFIAIATGNTVLQEMIDTIFEAARTVKNAHTQAGRHLSNLLRQKVVESLKELGDIDPFNIWEPIEMYIDGVGSVKILKIIDIGSPVIVDKADTNRLISE